MPGAGKTTLARALGAELRLPVVAKDDVKEALYDTLGIGDLEWSRRLGQAAFEVLFTFVASLLAAGQSAIAEANFFRGVAEERFGALPPHRIVQVRCHAPLELLAERWVDRARHPGHRDAALVSELAARFESGAHSALAVDGELIEVETSHPVAVDALAARLRPHLD